MIIESSIKIKKILLGLVEIYSDISASKGWSQFDNGYLTKGLKIAVKSFYS